MMDRVSEEVAVSHGVGSRRHVEQKRVASLPRVAARLHTYFH
jgi:hypothetical protein